MNSKLDEVLRATKYFENIVDKTGFKGLHKVEAINRGVSALTNFNPLRSIGMHVGTIEDEDGIKGDLTMFFDRRGV